MPKYLDTAAQANDVAKALLSLVPEDKQPAAAECIARLVNLGIRCSPRGVQHTVRLNAVREAVKGLPVKVGMVEKTDERTQRTYNALTTQAIIQSRDGEEVKRTYGTPNIEGATEDE